MIKVNDRKMDFKGSVPMILGDISNILYRIATDRDFVIIKLFMENEFCIDFNKILKRLEEIKNDGDKNDKTRD